MLGSYMVWCPPPVFMLYVCYLYPLPAIVKLIALCKAPTGRTQTTHYAGCHRGQATEDYTSLSK